MFVLYPKFDDEHKQLKHNTLVSYALFQILLFFIVAILSFTGVIYKSVFFLNILITLVLPLILIFFARYRYKFIVNLFIVISYLSAACFLFLIYNRTITAMAVLTLLFFLQATIAALIANWQTGLTIAVISIVLLIVDYYFENHGILNKVPSLPLSIPIFVLITSPILINIFIVVLSYSITLKLIFKQYKLESTKRQEYEELLIEKNVAVNEMNSELEESLAQLEETNDQLQLAIRKAEESDKLKSSFLQNISHEVRTPLNAIMGFLNLIKETNIRKECVQDKYIDFTIDSGQQLLNIVSDIVELSEIDAGLVKLNESVINLEELIGEVYSNHIHISEDKNLRLLLENKIKGKQAFVKSDPLKIKQILNNLLSNGLKYTKSGSVLLSCMLKENNIVIKVKDTGIGIEKDKLDYIFERFKQVEMDISRSYGGLGIGLTIVKGLIDCMAGSIEVKSEIGKGSEFIVKLPYKPVSEIPEQVISEKRTLQKGIGKILIAEDDEHNYLYLERLLRKKKMDILHARNGKEAVELFTKHPDIKMVLMDIKMPVMDGLQAFQEIRNISTDVKVVAVTAYALDQEKEKFKSHGFDGYLTKPVSKEDILDLFS